MIKEEFEKRAEKYANDKADKGNYDYAVGDNVFFGKSALEKAYIAGATENGIQWHDLRKDPNDLPKKVGNYLVCYLDTMLERHSFELSYVDYLIDRHWIDEDNPEIETYDEGVIAWAEIPEFKE